MSHFPLCELTNSLLHFSQVTIELIKYIKGSQLEDFRNAFLNLALPVVAASEPAPAKKIPITDGMFFTDWDRWEVHGSRDFKMQDFIKYFEVYSRFTKS